MGTNWKAEAEALKRKLEHLKTTLGEAAGPVGEKLQEAAAEAIAAARRAASPVSPLAPPAFPTLPHIEGVEFATIEAGIRYKGRHDVMLAHLAPGSTIAGAFTRSSTRAACICDCQAKLGAGGYGDQGAAIIVNSGNANAFTGQAGEEAVAAITESLAEALGLPAERVFSSSTGVIGEIMPHEKITSILGTLVSRLSGGGIGDAARAIMTTDTYAKGASAVIEGDGGAIHIAGIAKGSGMIAPDMATMLVYIFTDAAIPQPALQAMIDRQIGATFNSITVDSDTSTSDTLLVAATGQSAAAPLAGEYEAAFEAALGRTMHDLALQVVRDGEGASKLIEVRVSGATDETDAARIAFAIANSPLVKTAAAGEDPNWGRIVAAIGKSGAKAERDRLSIRFGDILVAENGWKSPTYTEEAGAEYMRQQELVIAVDLGLGTASRTVWTCDLTKRYIEINADYRS